MGNLRNGAWTDEDTLNEDQGGRYVKKPSQFRDRVTADGVSGFKAEPGRYVLYSSVGCPWAHRAVLFRTLKKLEDIIPLVNTEQIVGGQGWAFADGGHDVPGASLHARYLHEIYSLSDPDCTSRITVPVLWDTRTCRVVNNESSEIIRMFNSEFAEFAPATPDLYPKDLRAEIDETNALLLDGVNNGVNGCGRSSSQQAYEESFDLLFATLDQLEQRLSRQRYLCGDRQTEADWRFYPNLIRFDSIYYIGYKCNLRRLEDYHNLSNYFRELYQTPGIAAISDVEGMKRNTFGKAGPIGANGVIPKGPDLGLDRPHDRDRFAAAA
jgi:glutathionyl-hydroquinone reductase